MVLGRGAQSTKEVQDLSQPGGLGACNAAAPGLWSGGAGPLVQLLGAPCFDQAALGSGSVGGPVRARGPVASAWEGAAPM